MEAASADPLDSNQEGNIDTEDEKGYILSEPRVAIKLLAAAFSLMFSLDLFMIWLSPHSLKRLEGSESMAVLLAFTVQFVSLVQDLTKQPYSKQIATWQCTRGVKAIAATTNLWLYMMPTPFIRDTVTGRANCMLRWGEWTVLSMFMTFLVDAADSTEWWQPAVTALSQGISTVCGLLLPYIESVALWYFVTILSFLLFFYIFVRLYRREVELAQLLRSLPLGSYRLLKVRTTTRLLRLCCIVWTVLVTVWTIDAMLRIYLGAMPKTDWGFIADCGVDVTAKVLYTAIIDEYAQMGPVLYGMARGRVATKRMEFVWNDATDVIIVSVRLGDGSLSTSASPSCAHLLPGEESVRWIHGCAHGAIDGFERMLARGEKPKIPLRSDVITMERLIACAWWHQRFSCIVVPVDQPNGAGRVCDVSSSISENADGCVIIVRDVTDRDRVFEMEREVLSASIERIKDEEANRFSRHEVKNGVLAAISQERIRPASHRANNRPAVDSLKSEIRRFCQEPEMDKMLTSMRTGLSHTLETILSQAMARDVLHGNYMPRAAPCRIVEALGLDEMMGSSAETTRRFPIITTPAELPIVDMDRRLLLLVHRNAVSNACKYGKPEGIVLTEIELVDHVMTIRVINEPGPRHAELVRLSEEGAHRVNDRVFAKGTRLHSTSDRIDYANATARVSKGDGGWIMKKCADCMQGEASIRFEPTRTVFELTCPAPTRLDESFLDDVDLSEDVYAIGVDDCEFQRMVLQEMFKQLGLPDERIIMYGQNDDEIKQIGEELIRLFERIPSTSHVLLVIDENPDLAWPNTETISGSYAAMMARSKLPIDAQARLLALVRSSNDSESDVKLYSERTHGFLCKAPAEPDRVAILRMWVRRFGFRRVTIKSNVGNNLLESEEHSRASTDERNAVVAAAELGRLVRLLDHSMDDMPWSELWKWLHRIKGIVCSLRPAKPMDTNSLDGVDELIVAIEQLRSLNERPDDIEKLWAKLKQRVKDYATENLRAVAEFEGAPAVVRGAGRVPRKDS